ncbi:hypothetical protein JCGZ_22249 [Jatropha curcas]|uniref:DEK-C domain-containing protein n=1 Tax=Jatropha curcas TaxID=180498 RepID=A0A067JST7_JATCU|nr:hypothetical protein JCGZ_22249 [Jatropha curcas]
MVSDQELAKGIETVLRQSDPNAVTSIDGVVQQLEAKLGLDLSHKAGFIRDQISLLLRSHPTTVTTTTTTATALPVTQPLHPLPHPQIQPQTFHLTPKDHFALQHHPQFQQFPPHFALYTQHQQQQHHHQQQQQIFPQDLNFRQPQAPHPSQQQQHPQRQQPPPVAKTQFKIFKMLNLNRPLNHRFLVQFWFWLVSVQFR